MPELPEVETIKNDLKGKILNKKIKQVKVNLKRLVQNNLKEFNRILINNWFTDIERVGKLMIFNLGKSELKMLVHLKMTGQLVYCQGKRIIVGGHDDGNQAVCFPNKWTRVIFRFNDGSSLFFNDMRTFGYLKLVDNKELKTVKSLFGVEPLGRGFTAAELKEIIKGRTAPIKAVLLNQTLIAGIGNIYADEALFEAGIRPPRRAKTLKQREIEELHKAIKKVLTKAIKFRGTTFNSYVDADGQRGDFVRMLKVYGRAGEICKRCKTGVIKKIRVAQRGTHYCTTCQK